ncbi:MAG: NADH-quinone oxidoreductase subunit NuoK [Thermoplasmata archaeon]
MIPLEYELALAGILFGVGMYGILRRKNAIVVLMSVEIILNAAIMNLVAFSSYAVNPITGDPGGQVFAVLAIAVAAGEVCIGLGIYIVYFRSRKDIDLEEATRLR